MALAVSLQHIALLTVELGDRAAMSAKAVTCCIRIFEVLEGTDILNADILDMFGKYFEGRFCFYFFCYSNTWNNTSFLSDGVILPKEVSHITDYIITLGTR